jgi:hypothetical protein
MSLRKSGAAQRTAEPACEGSTALRFALESLSLNKDTAIRTSPTTSLRNSGENVGPALQPGAVQGVGGFGHAGMRLARCEYVG